MLFCTLLELRFNVVLEVADNQLRHRCPSEMISRYRAFQRRSRAKNTGCALVTLRLPKLLSRRLGQIGGGRYCDRAAHRTPQLRGLLFEREDRAIDRLRRVSNASFFLSGGHGYHLTGPCAYIPRMEQDQRADEDGLALPRDAFTKLDAEDDAIFYEPPRLVCHIDDGAIAALTGFYRTVLPPGGVLLDLMSSWVSHLPPEIGYAEVLGHGMN